MGWHKTGQDENDFNFDVEDGDLYHNGDDGDLDYDVDDDDNNGASMRMESLTLGPLLFNSLSSTGQLAKITPW